MTDAERYQMNLEHCRVFVDQYGAQYDNKNEDGTLRQLFSPVKEYCPMETHVVPEPSTWALLLVALAVAMFFRRRT